jgi:hypothetical protein
MVGPAAHELPDLLVQQKRHTALQIPREEMAQRHRHIRRMADHHHRPPAALGGHHRSPAGIRAYKGIMQLVIPHALAIEGQLVIEPVAAAHDGARGQIPVQPQLTLFLLSCFCGIGAIEPS